MGPAGTKPTVFFLHLQKCGGTSIKHAIHTGMLPRATGEAVVDLDAVAAAEQATAIGIHNFELRDQLLAYLLASRHTRAVMGHFRYTERLHEPFLDRVKFVTVLRQPAERLLSAYFWDRYKDDTYTKIERTLEEFLLRDGEPSHQARIHAERFVHMFRGDGATRPRLATQADIDNATRNLERFHLVGFLEDLGPFVDQLSEWADQELDIPVMKTSPATEEQRSEVTPELRAVVEEICEPAQRIYDRLRSAANGG